MNYYELFYLVSLALAIFIYFYFFYSRYHNKKIVKDNMNQKEVTRLILINVFILIPLIAYFFLKDYNYKIPDNIKNLAYPIMLLALFCIIKTSYDLGNEYSFTLQLRKDHKLVDTRLVQILEVTMN